MQLRNNTDGVTMTNNPKEYQITTKDGVLIIRDSADTFRYLGIDKVD